MTNICCDETLVMTKIGLSWQKFCCNKHTFVVTKDMFCCNKQKFCHDKNYTCGCSHPPEWERNPLMGEESSETGVWLPNNYNRGVCNSSVCLLKQLLQLLLLHNVSIVVVLEISCVLLS